MCPYGRRVRTRQSCQRNWPPRATCAPLCPVPLCVSGRHPFFTRTQGPAAPRRGLYDQASELRKLLGYVMLSTDITDTPAYSGKLVVTLIGMDTARPLLWAKVLKHSEPILLLAFLNRRCSSSTPSTWQTGVRQDRGGPVAPDENVIGLDAIRAPPSPSSRRTRS